MIARMRVIDTLVTFLIVAFFATDGVEGFRSRSTELKSTVIDNLGDYPRRFETPNQLGGRECESIPSPGSIFREECEKNGGAHAYDDLEESIELVFGSYKLMLNTTRFMDELNDARSSNGALEPVFEKYCRRVPIFKELEKYAADSLKTCLEPEEKRSIDVLRDISAMLLEFLCYGEGHRLATFVTTDGPECLSLAGNSIADCVRQSFDGYIPDTRFGGGASLGLGYLDDIPRILRPEFSTALDNFRNCSIEVLAECETNMTPNLMNVLIDSIQDEISKGIETPLTEISSTTVAPKLNPNLEEWLQTVSDIEIITGLVELHGTNVSHDDVEQYLREKCERNGGSTAYDDAENIPFFISNGIHRMADQVLSIFLGVIVENYVPKCKEYCRMVPALEKHLKYTEKSIRPCLDPEDRNDLKVTHNVINAVLEFFCQDEGDRLERLLTKENLKAWSSKIEFSNNCRNELFEPHSTWVSAIKDCTGLKRYQQCIVKVFGDGEDHTLSELMGSLFDHVIDATICKGLPMNASQPNPDIS